MSYFLLTLPTWLMCVVVIGGSVGLALVGMSLVRRHVSHETLAEGKDSAGTIFAVIAGFYSVVTAFIVVVVWGQFDKTREGADAEASLIGDIHRVAEAFPEETRGPLQRAVRDYANSVVADEWKEMARLKSSELTWKKFNLLWDAALAVQPKGERESAVYAVLLERLNGITDARRMRLIYARQSLPTPLWMLLILGAGLTVGSSFFLVTRHRALHALLTIALTTSISFVLFLIMAMDYPFTGAISVTPEAFQEVLANFH